MKSTTPARTRTIAAVKKPARPASRKGNATFQPPAVEKTARNVHRLEFPGKRVLFLVGTAHVSAESVKLVEKTVREKKPDVIAIELDEQRRRAMTDKEGWANLDIVQVIRKKQLFFFVGQFVMSSFQKKMSAKTGTRPGAEFLRALELAEAKGTPIVLADRNIGITLKRAWRLTRFRDKLRLFWSLLTGKEDELDSVDIEKLKGGATIDRMIKDFTKELPDAKRVLIDERDRYLACEIVNNLGKRTVAVVGAGHVPGMLRAFKKPLPPELKDEISIVPRASRVARLLPWLIPLIVIGIVVWGFISGDKAVARDAAIYWVVVNAALTGIGCLLALAHPLTTLSGMIASPITSLNPTIGAGMVTAFVQAMLVKPRVRDLEEIRDKSLRIRDWWRNRLTKIMLVFLLSSIGSAIGTFVALPLLMRAL